jgi:outer membrane protein
MRILVLAASVAALALAPAAHAGSLDGKWQIKALATAILPTGDIKDVRFASPAVAAALPANADARGTDSYVPTVAVEYFVTPSVSLETICCLTRTDVDGAKGIKGAALINNIAIIPATLTAKYHFGSGAAIKPYVGAGPTYWLMFKERPGATMRSLGATRVDVGNKLGFALQAGVDVPLNDRGLALSIDAKRYFIDRSAKWYDATGARILETEHNLDPWVLSAGLAYRF